MSTPVTDRPTPAPGAEPLDHGDGGVDVLDGVVTPQHRGHGSLWSATWRFLISMRTGLWLILVLGLLTFAGTIIMQASADVLADKAMYDQWYQSGPVQKYGGWAPVFGFLGLYDVFGTWYFRAIFALLAVSLLACSVNRAPRLWRVATKPRTSMSEAFFSHAPLKASFDLSEDTAAASDRVRGLLRDGRFRVLDGTAAPGDLYADRFRWAPFGTVLAHISFLIIMLGFVVSAAFGFRIEALTAPIGTPVEVGHGTGMTVLAHSFHDSYYDNGTPKDYVSDVSLLVNGTEVARQNVRVNDPLIHDGVWFHQSFFGIGADLLATEGDQVLFQQLVSMGMKSNDGMRTYGQFEVPAKGLTVWIGQAASGKSVPDLPPGTVFLEIHKAGVEQPAIQVLTQGQPVEIDGITWTFERNRQYTGLTVKTDPGSIFIWVGSILLMLGSCLVFFVPHRRIWVQVRPNADGTSHVKLAAPTKRDPAFEPVFADLVHRIRAAG